MLASIALYPDELLNQLLMASAFPLEVVAAARSVKDPMHPDGDMYQKDLGPETARVVGK